MIVASSEHVIAAAKIDCPSDRSGFGEDVVASGQKYIAVNNFGVRQRINAVSTEITAADRSCIGGEIHSPAAEVDIPTDGTGIDHGVLTRPTKHIAGDRTRIGQ